GLVGSILVGLSFAKASAYVYGLPYVYVDHIEAHAMTAFLREGRDGREAAPVFPFVSLVVSGGHTTLFLVTGFTGFKVIGETLDDAAGEAFDKVAKLLGLGYPGGAAIDALAKKGNPGYVLFPRPYISKGSLDFSFSGVKTAVLNHVKGLNRAVPADILPDIAASFQEAVVDTLVAKAVWALKATGARDLVVSGGVACNSRLRDRMTASAEEEGIRLFIPKPYFCSDNGAMVASIGFHLLKEGLNIGTLSTNALPHW
ncbi:MAG: tRNA (adenosine(37)-N6)-threonylcarbamoyltransferase complex transferase subunit TsaD, partial [Deltaproteobacteria bacterium]|nr:tRNA (adenosine(37)-N6)-threonylcarbamoyltransferase complex transferase subunit TsaD [Deltaproteobacteria bacterium]